MSRFTSSRHASAAAALVLALIGGCEPPVLSADGAILAGTVVVNAQLIPRVAPEALQTAPNRSAPIVAAGGVVSGFTSTPVDVRLTPTSFPAVVTFTAPDAGGLRAGARGQTVSFRVMHDGDLTWTSKTLGRAVALAPHSAPHLERDTVAHVADVGPGGQVRLEFASLTDLESPPTIRIRVVSTSGTVVPQVTLGAYATGLGHPAAQSFNGRLKSPLGAVNIEGELDSDGNWVGRFESLLLDPVIEAGDSVLLFAFVDADGTSGPGPANLLSQRLSRADLLSSQLTALVAPPSGIRRVGLSVVIDVYADDTDFDDALDDDRNGDGKTDDNCLGVYNPDQVDQDDDGVGDICDNCPSVRNAGQENADGVGRGDACNTDDDTTCPWFHGQVLPGCAIDSDGDEIEDRGWQCPDVNVPCVLADAREAVLDNCPGVVNRDQADLDRDGIGDACDADDDGDARLDTEDNCTKRGNADQRDSDNDGIGDACDLCPQLNDPLQGDLDRDGIGDACDADRDDDGVCDPGATPSGPSECSGEDICPQVFDPQQLDADGDGIGDACDLCPTRTGAFADRDSDGVGDACDVCPDAPNPQPTCATDADCVFAGGRCLDSGVCLGALDSDVDGEADACDSDRDGDGVRNDIDLCPDLFGAENVDADDDGVGDGCDICPHAPDPNQTDSDGDGVGDACDLCPQIAAAAAACSDDADCLGAANRCTVLGRCATDTDSDEDGIGDACEADDDDDNICDACAPYGPLSEGPICRGVTIETACRNPGAVGDNCRTAANEAQTDVDADGIGDACDEAFDVDSDGVPDPQDVCPDVFDPGQQDIDLDGVGDVCDVCVNQVDPDQRDADLDGIGDVCDVCPGVADPEQGDADADGVGDACDTDADDDGLIASDDNCPLIANALQQDTDEDGAGDACDVCTGLRNPSQADFDGDGRGDACDNCPTRRNFEQLDVDEDGPGDVCDVCPTVPDRAQLDTDADGTGDACTDDDDGDTIADSTDNCPLLPNFDQADLDLDETGDVCDPDIDGDEIGNPIDACPNVANAVFDLGQTDELTLELVDGDFGNDEPDATLVSVGSGLAGAFEAGDEIRIAGEVGALSDVADFLTVATAAAGTGAFDPFLAVSISGDVRLVVFDATAIERDGSIAYASDFGVAARIRIRPAADIEPGTTVSYVLTLSAGGTSDIDGDALPDACDICARAVNVGDRDGDGTDDACDLCIVAPGTCVGIDVDNDTVCDFRVDDPNYLETCSAGSDNCENTPNLTQADFNADGDGDACDDTDVDGVLDDVDVCPSFPDANQADSDADGAGDACDLCVNVFNPDQSDIDGDELGDACDPCRVAAGSCEGIDDDNDGACFPGGGSPWCGPSSDNCPTLSNVDQFDTDGDGIGDACNDSPDIDLDLDEYNNALDNCPTIPNPSQDDLDGDAIGDACDPDRDGDGWCNDLEARDGLTPGCIGIDICPDVPNPGQGDLDQDGTGDACDSFDVNPTLAEAEPNDVDAHDVGFLPSADVLRVQGALTASDIDKFLVRAPRDGTLTATLRGGAPGLTVSISTAADPDAPIAFAGPENPARASARAAALSSFVVEVVGPATTIYDLDLRLVFETEALDPRQQTHIDEVFVGSDRAQSFTGDLGGEARGFPIDIDDNAETDDAEVDEWRVRPLRDGTLHLRFAFEADALLDPAVLLVSLGAATPSGPLLYDGRDAVDTTETTVAEVAVRAGDDIVFAIGRSAGALAQPNGSARYVLDVELTP